MYNHVYVVNYTPHTVTLLRADGSVHMRMDSRGVARATEQVTSLPDLTWDPFGDSGMTDALPRVSKSFGEIAGLPEPMDNVNYIVSQIVFDALPNRTDLLVPSGVVRDTAGQVVGCRCFSARVG